MIFEFVLQFVVEILTVFTGELILFVLTLGKHRPIWRARAARTTARFIILYQASFWIGLAFWLIVGFLAGRFLLR
jgi:hypothetical protein